MESGEVKSKREEAREELISDEPFEKEEEEHYGIGPERAKECAKVIKGCLEEGAYDIARKFIKHIEKKEK